MSVPHYAEEAKFLTAEHSDAMSPVDYSYDEFGDKVFMIIPLLVGIKEGFLRDVRSLIQIIGRAARNVNAKVVDRKSVV